MAHGYPDFEGQKSRVYLTSEWAAKEGTDKTLDIYEVNVAAGVFKWINHTVAAGKNFYVTQASVAAFATALLSANNNRMVIGHAEDLTTGDVLWRQGGNGGCGMAFPTPKVIPAGHVVYFEIGNVGGDACTIEGTLTGYEI